MVELIILFVFGFAFVWLWWNDRTIEREIDEILADRRRQLEEDQDGRSNS